MPEKAFSAIACYIVAHADDWQLFMQPNAYIDITSPDNKTVFIITTAGDAGLGETYWHAREEGTKSSVRFGLAPLGNISEINGSDTFNGKKVSYWAANNTIYYFLRLPDGNVDGTGFLVNGNQSLLKFMQENAGEIATVDKLSVYTNWQDFSATLEAIITSTRGDVSNVYIHYLSTDAALNPNDHADHIATGYAIHNMSVTETVEQVLYRGYSVNTIQQHLQPNELFWKTAMFAAYEKAVFDISGYSTLKESTKTYITWCQAVADFIIINHK